MRVAGNNSMAFSLRFDRPDHFIARTNLESIGLGIFIAVHFFLLVGNLWIYFASKDISYALLALFGVNGLIGFLTIEGLMFQYIFPNTPEMIDYIIMLPYMLGVPLYVYFLLHYLKIIPRYPNASRVYLIVLTLFAAVSMNIGLFHSFSVAMLNYEVWNIINSILLIPIIFILLARKDFRYTYLVMGACLILNIGVIIRIARNLGYVPDGEFQYYSYFFGVIGHLILMNVVAALTFRDSLIAKDKVLIEALKTAQEAEKKLEEKVSKRTSSLRHALDLVKTTLEFERQAQEDQRLFFETVSHELRTPLAVIDAAAKNMELDAHEFDELSKKRFQRIQRATAQLSDLVKRCFREDRFEPLNRGLRRRHAKLQTLIADACDSLAFSPQKHQLAVDLGNLPETFLCDPDMTRLALRTIVGNAAKYSSAGSSVWIKGNFEEKGITLKVIDNGPGVAERDLPHLFKRYYRGSNASHVSGTGLGLPLARELIQIQGGHMRIDSVLGKGFEVTIFLPIYQPSPERQELDDIPIKTN
jgi:signal transduction histidine kinase